MKNCVFVYGTLSFTPVMSALLGRRMTGVPAQIKGYKRVWVKDKAYPALVAAPGITDGVLHQDVTDDELQLLDTFEDDFYKRVAVTIRLPDRKTVPATTYVIPTENRSFATNELWDRDEFGRKHLPQYIHMVSQYRQDYLDGGAGSQSF
jgi:gamma-glutamylcyclotransferase (GGCT)/AIG2-like uncharacterized protein YtfP